MKRRLNTLKGKRLVTGDTNLMTKDEICINATPNGVEVKEIGTDGKIKDLAGNQQEQTSDDAEYYEYIRFKISDDYVLDMYQFCAMNLYNLETKESGSVISYIFKCLDEVIVAYNCYNSNNQGGYKCLFKGNYLLGLNNTNRTSIGDNLKGFGYKFNNVDTIMISSEGVHGSAFLSSDEIEVVINSIPSFNTIPNKLKLKLPYIINSVIALLELTTEDEINSLVQSLEYKPITKEEYEGRCWQEAKAYYDTLKPN